jgi:hypothetical protein
MNVTFKQMVRNKFQQHKCSSVEGKLTFNGHIKNINEEITTNKKIYEY